MREKHHLAAPVHSLSRDRTCSPSVYGMTLQLSRPSQANHARLCSKERMFLVLSPSGSSRSAKMSVEARLLGGRGAPKDFGQRGAYFTLPVVGQKLAWGVLTRSCLCVSALSPGNL